MKKIVFLIAFVCAFTFAKSQDVYWVYLTDKQGSEFNPYEYFDQKTIDKRIESGISLNDISDFPVSSDYTRKLAEFSDEIVGVTRWFNAVAVQTDEIRIQYIKNLEFVLSVEKISNDAELTSIDKKSFDIEQVGDDDIKPQLNRMGGEIFIENNIDGKGIRVAIFDGGFPGVNTHEAFAHLRQNKQIIKTWNFPLKKEDVYGWNSHGTSVLSCIAGQLPDGTKLGLATGSEFLLARTEVNAEPAKEEVYWMMAVEWADKNGADVINSSLGYGADRHRISDMDGKTCLVTRAANMAASKGMLVCNAMGNEGSDKSWKTLGAPADADSILSVAGIEPSNDFHIDFSSYGPTADGRLKPNVSAYGEAYVANPNGYGFASGTSFASPLVAGFSACAWQTRPGLTAMEMKLEIEKSGDVYPYYDYANGYGVPQASYFFNTDKAATVPSFTLSTNDDYVIIAALKSDEYKLGNMYYQIKDATGKIVFYEQADFLNDIENKIYISKSALAGGKTLYVCCNAYIQEFKLDGADEKKFANIDKEIVEAPSVHDGTDVYVSKVPAYDEVSGYGVNAKFYFQPYFSRSFMIYPSGSNYDMVYGKSGSFNIGFRYKQNIAKWYSLGLNLEWGSSKLGLKDFSTFVQVNQPILESYKEKFSAGSVNFELYQRIRLVPCGAVGIGLFWDAGFYVSHIVGATYDLEYKTANTAVESSTKLPINDKLQYGIRSRIGYGMLSIYGQYRLTDYILDDVYSMPKLEIGIEVSIPTGM